MCFDIIDQHHWLSGQFCKTGSNVDGCVPVFIWPAFKGIEGGCCNNIMGGCCNNIIGPGSTNSQSNNNAVTGITEITKITEITTEITMEITKITIKWWGGVMLGVVGLVCV